MKLLKKKKEYTIKLSSEFKKPLKKCKKILKKLSIIFQTLFFKGNLTLRLMIELFISKLMTFLKTLKSIQLFQFKKSNNLL